MNKQIIWFDPDEWPDADGLLLHGGLAVDAGVEISPFPEGETAGLLREKGFSLLRRGDKAQIQWYAMPRLYVFARQGEVFFASDKPVTPDSARPIWRIDGEWRVTKAAGSMPAFISAALKGALPESGQDSGEYRLFSSWREAEKAGELFLRNDTPWKRSPR